MVRLGVFATREAAEAHLANEGDYVHYFIEEWRLLGDEEVKR